MRLLYVTDALAIFGGLERILIDKANGLSQFYNYDVELLTVNQGNHAIPYKLAPYVRHKDLGIGFHCQYHYRGIRRILMKRKLQSLFIERLHEEILHFKPDIVICVRADLCSAVAKAKGPIPLVFESHTSYRGTQFEDVGMLVRMKGLYYNLSVKRADYIVTLTEGDAVEWKKINPHVFVIPNIVHLNESARYSSCTSKSVIFVGRYSRQKGIDYLLKIWEIVQTKHKDWHLQLFCGYGEERDKLLLQIKKMQCHIHVHEATPSIFEKYRDSSMLLLTSRYEPFGLVLPEAMSFGLPVVAFKCPYGPADIITDGLDGFLVSNYDVQKFAQRVCQLIESEELRKTMGTYGVKSSQRYAQSYILPMWISFFEKVVRAS